MPKTTKTGYLGSEADAKLARAMRPHILTQIEHVSDSHLRSTLQLRDGALARLLAKWDAYVNRCGTMEGYVTMTAEHANELRALIAPGDKPRYPVFPDLT